MKKEDHALKQFFNGTNLAIGAINSETGCGREEEQILEVFFLQVSHTRTVNLPFFKFLKILEGKY